VTKFLKSLAFASSDRESVIQLKEPRNSQKTAERTKGVSLVHSSLNLQCRHRDIESLCRYFVLHCKALFLKRM
jgi:hypothetical protein